MNSNSSSNEPEVVTVARAKAEYLKAEMMAEFKRFESGEVELTPTALKVFEKKWLNEAKVIEDRVFAASITPASQPYVPTLQGILDDVQAFARTYVNALAHYHAVPGGEAPAEKTESEKEREREERRKRMAKFRGEG